MFKNMQVERRRTPISRARYQNKLHKHMISSLLKKKKAFVFGVYSRIFFKSGKLRIVQPTGRYSKVLFE